LAIPDKVAYAFDQRVEPMAKVQFPGIVRAVSGTFLFSQPDWRSGGSVHQALKDLDQLTALESPAIEEVESEDRR
jgi:hypothetical protein